MELNIENSTQNYIYVTESIFFFFWWQHWNSVQFSFVNDYLRCTCIVIFLSRPYFFPLHPTRPVRLFKKKYILRFIIIIMRARTHITYVFSIFVGETTRRWCDDKIDKIAENEKNRLPNHTRQNFILLLLSFILSTFVT